jgi:hypothetical protein
MRKVAATQRKAPSVMMWAQLWSPVALVGEEDEHTCDGRMEEGLLDEIHKNVLELIKPYIWETNRLSPSIA